MIKWIAVLIPLIIAGFSLWYVDLERQDRKNARVARAWTLIHETHDAPGNVGQIAALESLHRDGAKLWYINLHHAFLRGVQLPGVDLRAAALTYADLSDTNLRDADLSGADLTCADFTRADLSGTTLADANVTAADLRFANNLTQEQLDETCADPYDPAEHKPFRACARNGDYHGFPSGFKPPPPCSQPAPR